MENTLLQITNLLTAPPGNLVYHLILVFAVLFSLQAIWLGHSHGKSEQSSRIILGLTVLLLAQVLLFIVSGLAWQNVFESHSFLPPLDRAVVAFSILWIVWMWTFADKKLIADILLAILTLGLIGLFTVTLQTWAPQSAGLEFNTSWLDFGWSAIGAFYLVLGFLLILLRRPAGWGFGLGFILINMAGFALQMFLPPQPGDFSGIIRLTQMCTFPLLPALARQIAAIPAPAARTEQPQQPVIVRKIAPEALPEKRKYSADLRSIYAWMQLASKIEPTQVGSSLTRAISQTMLADLCFLISSPEIAGQLYIQIGYDLIREDTITGRAISPEGVPNIMSALMRGKPIILNQSVTPPPDLRTISGSLGFKEIGNLLFAPMVAEKKVYGGVILMSPYSNRSWDAEDQSYLVSIAENIVPVLQRSTETATENKVDDSLTGKLDEAQKTIEMLTEDNRRLQEELTQQISATAWRDQPTNPSEITALLEIQEANQKAITALKAQNEELRAQIASLTTSPQNGANPEQLEAELRLSLEEIARLQNTLADARMRIGNLENQVSQPREAYNEEREVIASIAQELRQPMSSIVGYTDLLLGESVGILGALQRKFMERIKASTARMRSLLDDLVQVSAIQSGSIELMPQPIDLGEIIDRAIADTSAQLREKNITLEMELPEELPQMYADRDAMLQVLIQLLQNAGAASPFDGSISFRVSLESDEKSENRTFVLIQVTDTGGGIPAEDLPRVFLRRYRAENALIPGVGDTGVGLSIARTLVEAHGGRIWVDSDPGATSTFSVLLPIEPEPAKNLE